MKILVGVDLGSYTFDASAKTVTITGLNALTLDQILLITNVTDQEIIYQFNNTAKGGTIAGNVVTLEHDTTAQDDADTLQIWVEYEVQTQAVSGPLTDAELRASAVPISAASLPLPTGAATAANQQTDALTDAQLRATPVPVSGTVSVTEPVSVDDNAGSLTVDNPTLSVVGGGVEATALRVTIANDSTGLVSIDDNGGSLTVDGTVAVSSSALPTGAATSANQLPDGHNVTVDNASGAAAVNIQDGGNSITVDGAVTATGPLTDAELRATPVPVSGTVSVTEPVSVDDNGGSLTVDGSVSITGAVDTELTTADLDTGAGTDTRAVVGLVGSASGGGALIPGSAADGLLVNLGANNDVTVTGSVTATGPLTDAELRATPVPVSGTVSVTEPVSVDDNGGSLTVDGTVAVSSVAGTVAVTQSGTWDEVGINDSGNSITVDDGAGSLTIDGSVAVTGTVAVQDVRAATPAQSSPAPTTVNTVILASNADRLGATIYNEGAAICYMKLGATASTTSYTLQIAVGGYYEVPFGYTGAIDGITSSGTAQLRCTELT